MAIVRPIQLGVTPHNKPEPHCAYVSAHRCGYRVRENQLTKADATVDETPDKLEKPDQKISFKDLGLMPDILKALDDVGYTHPTPIQAGAIPAALERKDVLGIAQTGTGKTGAFTLPILQSMAKGRARARMPRSLIVCPTRELAAQVAENVEQYAKYLKIEMALLIGGVSFAKQELKLNRGVDILIATPGRLLDHFERGKVMLNGVQALVVDEADRMLDMGFIPDIEKIFKLTPFTRQVLFFSATMPSEIQRLVDQFLHHPFKVQIERKNMTAKTVKQYIVKMPGNDFKQKRTALRYVIDNHDVKNGIVFCNRKKDVDIVAKSLSVHGHNAAPIHGDLRQSQRMETLEAFKNGDVKLLVASDVAARGLDVPSVSHVLNFDVPTHSEDYVHRIGRTGRAGRKGQAVMFVTPRDKKYLDAILEMIKETSIEELEIPGLAEFPAKRGRGRKPTQSKGKGKGRGRSSQAHTAKDGASQTEKPAQKKRRDHTGKKTQDTEQKSQGSHRIHPKEQGRKNRDHQERARPKKSRRGELPKNEKSGFGDDMPAFFGGKD